MTAAWTTLEAEVRVRLDLRSGRPAGAYVDPDQQPPVSRLLVGQPVAEVLQRIPRLYSVCAIAQATAAVEACEDALGIEVSPHQSNARRLLVSVESAKEHLRHILLAWPRLLGEKGSEGTPYGISGVVAAYQAALYGQANPYRSGGERLAPDRPGLDRLSRRLDTLLSDAVFGMAPSAWSESQGEAALLEWAARYDTVAARLVRRVSERGWAQLGCSQVAALPPLTAGDLHQRLGKDDAAAFAARPTWGSCRETTPFTRNQDHPLVAELTSRHGNGALARLVARLTELADISSRLRAAAALLRADAGLTPPRGALASRIGLAQIEAARGRLIHRVAMTGPLVSLYQIVAPTAWNFHPSGVAAQGLRHLVNAASEGVEAQAELLIETIDPCVRYQLTVQREG